VESKFRKDATSKSGARGLMQVIPATGEWIAEELGMKNFNIEKI
jgi:soluble lytic murein transglycosylase